ncbi:MAG: toll/interleukin-1 receptor domain-containing protein, partial [Bacteroidota bacterium]
MPYDVFINYRRDDTLAMAVVLEIFLNNSFSNLQVFLDQEGIEAEKWTKKLEQALEESSVVITLIGHKYLDVRNEHGERRIDLDDDWVRKEIEIAVDRKKTIIPVLVDGAKMLSKEAFKKWPKLQEWLEWQAETVAWKTFNDDFEKLVTTIEKQSGRKRKQSGAVASPINPLDAYPLPEINPLAPDEEDQVLGGIV